LATVLMARDASAVLMWGARRNQVLASLALRMARAFPTPLATAKKVLATNRITKAPTGVLGSN
jgi:hypothetical protein